MQRFDNLATTIQGKKVSDFDLSAEVHQDEDKLVAMMVERVEKEFDEHPFIVFMAKHNEPLVNKLKAVC